MAAVMLITCLFSITAMAEEAEGVKKAMVKEREVIKAHMENVQCVHDGITLKGVLTLPDMYEGDKLPMVILSHGFMSSNSEMSNLAKSLQTAGFASVRFNFMASGSGSTKSDGAFTDISIWTEVADLNAILDYVLTLDVVDTNNVFLHGNSMGGFVTSLVAPQRAADINAICLWYPAMCICDDARNGHMQDSVFDVENPPETLKVQRDYISREFIVSAMAFDPYPLAEQYTNDVLIFHGTADTMVPIAYSERLAAEYESAVFVPIEGSGHGFYDSETFDMVANRMIKFLNEHIYSVNAIQ